jgi:CDP-diacylglycerol--glycerol-3-phosphate 3-phosphatidyltransferase
MKLRRDGVDPVQQGQDSPANSGDGVFRAVLGATVHMEGITPHENSVFTGPNAASRLELRFREPPHNAVALNLPNKLTVSRILILPFFVVALMADRLFPGEWTGAVGRWIALGLFIVATITDYLDGAIARARNLVTPFGQLFDPLADKLLTMSAFVCLVEIQTDTGAPVLPAWAVIIILGREFLVTGIRTLAAAQGEVIQADQLGKHKTAWQMGGILALLLVLALGATFEAMGSKSSAVSSATEILRWVVLISVLGLTVLSGLVFLRKNWGLFQPETEGTEN